MSNERLKFLSHNIPRPERYHILQINRWPTTSYSPPNRPMHQSPDLHTASTKTKKLKTFHPRTTPVYLLKTLPKIIQILKAHGTGHSRDADAPAGKALLYLDRIGKRFIWKCILSPIASYWRIFTIELIIMENIYYFHIS